MSSFIWMNNLASRPSFCRVDCQQLPLTSCTVSDMTGQLISSTAHCHIVTHFSQHSGRFFDFTLNNACTSLTQQVHAGAALIPRTRQEYHKLHSHSCGSSFKYCLSSPQAVPKEGAGRNPPTIASVLTGCNFVCMLACLVFECSGEEGFFWSHKGGMCDCLLSLWLKSANAHQVLCVCTMYDACATCAGANHPSRV